jgi:hypothetical protein
VEGEEQNDGTFADRDVILLIATWYINLKLLERADGNVT